MTAKKTPASCENEMLIDKQTMDPDTSSYPNCSLEIQILKGCVLHPFYFVFKPQNPTTKYS